jgi:hypothetical protein
MDREYINSGSTEDIFSALGMCCELAFACCAVAEKFSAEDEHIKGNHQKSAQHYRNAAELSHLSGEHETEHLLNIQEMQERDAHNKSNYCTL